MRKVVLHVLLVLSILFWGGSVAMCSEKDELPPCNPGADPQDPQRPLDVGQYIVRISQPKKIVWRTKHHWKGVGCELRRGAPVVTNKDGVALWGFPCGNDILEPEDWKPEGEKTFVSPQPSVSESTEKQVPAQVTIIEINEAPPAQPPLPPSQPPPAGASPTPPPTQPEDFPRKRHLHCGTGCKVTAVGVAGTALALLTKFVFLGGKAAPTPTGRPVIPPN